MIFKATGIATPLQLPNACRLDGIWSLKVACTRCLQQRVEEGWVSVRTDMPDLCYVRCESSALQAGTYFEAHISVSGVCSELEFLTLQLH